MKQGVHIEQLLHWRLALAERDAPAAPHADTLLAALRPWWEQWPERFKARVARLSAVPLAYGYAMAGSEPASGYPVPTLVTGSDDADVFARVLYLTVRTGQLRMRFSLDDATHARHERFEATFIDAEQGTPVLLARAERAQTGEYRVDAALSDDVATAWEALKVTDRMPFRLILEPTDRARSE